MTIAEMHIAFDLALDAVNGLDYPDFQPEKKDHWLNQGIRAFIKTRISGNNAKGEGFEQTQKRIEDIRTLIKDVDINPSIGSTKPNGYLFRLPNDYYIKDEEECTFTYVVRTVTTTVRKGITECRGDAYRQSIDNPFSEHRLKHGFAKPLRLFTGDYVELISDGNYIITKYHLRYVKEPATVYAGTYGQIIGTPVNCDLPEIVHDEVVRMSVRMALSSLGDPEKYQLNTVEEQKQE